MLSVRPDLILDDLPEPRRITLNVAAVTPGNLTLLEALDISEASGIDTDDFVSVLQSKGTHTQALLLYALAWVLARRTEPDLTFEEVKTYHLEVKGTPATEEQVEREQKRAGIIAGVAMLSGVTPDEAEQMTVAEVSAVTSITKARRRNVKRKR